MKATFSKVTTVGAGIVLAGALFLGGGIGSASPASADKKNDQVCTRVLGALHCVDMPAIPVPESTDCNPANCSKPDINLGGDMELAPLPPPPPPTPTPTPCVKVILCHNDVMVNPDLVNEVKPNPDPIQDPNEGDPGEGEPGDGNGEPGDTPGNGQDGDNQANPGDGQNGDNQGNPGNGQDGDNQGNPGSGQNGGGQANPGSGQNGDNQANPGSGQGNNGGGQGNPGSSQNGGSQANPGDGTNADETNGNVAAGQDQDSDPAPSAQEEVAAIQTGASDGGTFGLFQALLVGIALMGPASATVYFLNNRKQAAR